MSVTELKPGDHHYQAYVGPVDTADLYSAMQFNLLTSCGLRSHHYLLDIGCGSLRAGKLLIPYLDKSRYFGVEPNQWLIDEGISMEIGADIVSIKMPQFNNSENFDFGVFGQSFDFILAQSIFSHSSQNQIELCLEEVKKCLKPSGLFLATFVLGKEDYTGFDWVYPECITYRDISIREMVHHAGLQCVKTKWRHTDIQSWYLIYHPGNEKHAVKIARDLFAQWKHHVPFKRRIVQNKLIYNPVVRTVYRFLKSFLGYKS